MLVGEAQGREEDLRGKPFVGRSGRILDEILETAGFRRKGLFITSIVKCRPPVLLLRPF
jgi:DNA polymerase